MSSATEQASSNSERAPAARRRTAFACESCRIKKTKCDGLTPCSKCKETGSECFFGIESVSTKGKSDVILNAILRVESSLGQLHERVASISKPSPVGLTGTAFTIESPGSEGTLRSQPRHSVHAPNSNGVDNAIISEAHNSTTESILAWPIFDSIPSIRVHRSASIFNLENSRTPLVSMRRPSPPYVSEEDTDRILYAFQSTVNFSYPVISLEDLSRCRSRAVSGDLADDSLDSCLALLVMALGCAAELISELLPRENDISFTLTHHPMRQLSKLYFEAAIKPIHNAYTEISTASAQCLMLAAIFYAYLQRPLQAWSMLSSAATKCRVLLSYGTNTNNKAFSTLSSDDDSSECVRRIFWSCFILESDYVSELNALPRFGVAEMESSVSLPGRFNTHSDPQQESQSSLYFLACISMRRLLNRVHHLLFAKGDGVMDGMKSSPNTNDPRLPSMVSELDEQLNMWRELLPPAFRFTIDTQPVESQHGAFLRQRYLVCKSLIYRPYLMSALAQAQHGTHHQYHQWQYAQPARPGSHHATSPLSPVHQHESDITAKCRTWAHACILHILNLHSFSHTVLVDTWICALSMAGTMAMLLAAFRSPSLRPCLGEEIYLVGPHLRKLLGGWMVVPEGGEGGNAERGNVVARDSWAGAASGVSPSVQRAVGWIVAFDEILQA